MLGDRNPTGTVEESVGGKRERDRVIGGSKWCDLRDHGRELGFCVEPTCMRSLADPQDCRKQPSGTERVQV